MSLWDDADVDALRLQTDLLHREGALAGVELMYGGAQVCAYVCCCRFNECATDQILRGHSTPIC